MKLMVTGASGLLGANLVETALSQAVDVIAVYQQHPIHFPDAKVIQADLTDARTVDDLVCSCRPEWTIHCAAATNVDWCETHPHPTRHINVEASRYLAQAIRHVGGKLIYISTDMVFGEAQGYHTEQDACAPLNVYAESKLAGEFAIREIMESALVIRTNIYGWNLVDKRSLAEWALAELEAHKPINGFYDVTFTPILVNDLAEILLSMMHKKLTGVYHVAASHACSKYEFMVHIADLFGLDSELIRPASINASALPASRPKNIALQTTKISQALNRPMPDVLAGLQRFKALRTSGYVGRLISHRGG
jgi:dTDP-4-dehydrorhamnose reductase